MIFFCDSKPNQTKPNPLFFDSSPSPVVRVMTMKAFYGPIVHRLVTTDMICTDFVWKLLNRKINSRARRWLNLLWHFLEWSNNGFVWLLLIPALYYVVFMGQYFGEQYASDKALQTQLQFFMFCIVADIAIVGTLKATIGRKRPTFPASDSTAGTTAQLLHIGPDRYSFPSGHCTRAIIAAVFGSAFLLTRSIESTLDPVSKGIVTAQQAVVAIAIALWTIGMGLGRIALGRHFVLDVVLGYIIGMMEIMVCGVMWPHVSPLIQKIMT